MAVSVTIQGYVGHVVRVMLGSVLGLLCLARGVAF